MRALLFCMSNKARFFWGIRDVKLRFESLFPPPSHTLISLFVVTSFLKSG